MDRSQQRNLFPVEISVFYRKYDVLVVSTKHLNSQVVPFHRKLFVNGQNRREVTVASIKKVRHRKLLLSHQRVVAVMLLLVMISGNIL